MRNIAIGLMFVVLVAILIEPLVEFVNVLKERVVLGSSISNSLRVARDQSLEYISHRELEAKVDEERFVEFFSEAFEQAMDVSRIDSSGNTLTFTPNDDRYHTFTVSLSFYERRDDYTGQVITEVDVRAETKYKFKTKYLQLAEQASRSVDYHLIDERSFILSIKN